jgi:hypothetical protein
MMKYYINNIDIAQINVRYAQIKKFDVNMGEQLLLHSPHNNMQV